MAPPALSLQISTTAHHRIHTATVRLDSVGWVVSGTKHLVTAGDALDILELSSTIDQKSALEAVIPARRVALQCVATGLVSEDAAEAHDASAWSSRQVVLPRVRMMLE